MGFSHDFGPVTASKQSQFKNMPAASHVKRLTPWREFVFFIFLSWL